MTCKKAVVVSLLLAASLIFHADCKFVRTHLNSKWKDTPVLLEASEYIGNHDSQLFWKFVSETKLLNVMHPPGKERYVAFMAVADGLLSSMTHDLMKLSLSTRMYAPTIEMYNQIAKQRQTVQQQQQLDGGEDCTAFVELGAGTIACSVGRLRTLLAQLPPSPPAGAPPTSTLQQQLYQFDHVYPSTAQSGVPVAILYAEIGSKQFSRFHDALTELASQQLVKYVLRHYIESNLLGKVRLSGYGVQLAVKSTEYKAMDDSKLSDDDQTQREAEDDELQGFLFGALRQHHPEMAENLGEFQAYLKESLKEIVELKAWQLQDLGLQASQRVMSSTDNASALHTLMDIAQYLPTYTRTLYQLKIDRKLREEISKNHERLSEYGISPGTSYLLINGILVDENSLDVFSLLDTLQHEVRLVDSLYQLGVQPSDLQATLSLKVHADHKTFVVDMRSDSVVFMNDLEKDPKYTSWAHSVGELLRPVYPGMVRQIARNLYTVVLCLDPWSDVSIDYLDYINLFLTHAVPARFGLLLVPQDDPDVLNDQNPGYTLTKAFLYINKTVSAKKAFEWIMKVLAEDAPGYSSMVETFAADYGQQSADEVFGPDSPYTALVEESVRFYRSKGLGQVPQVLMNGVQMDMEEDFETAIVNSIQQLTPALQQAVYRQTIKDKTDIYSHLMSRSSVLERLNAHVTSSKGKVLDLSSNPSAVGFSNFSTLPASAMSSTISAHMWYFINPDGEFVTSHVTVWVAVDLTTLSGRRLVRNSLEYLSTSVDVRIALLHNLPSSSTQSHALHGFLEALHLTQRPTVVQEFMWQFCDPNNSPPSFDLPALKLFAQGVKGVKMDELEIKLQESSSSINDIIIAHMIYCHDVLMLKDNQLALLTNGKVIGPLTEAETFEIADFKLLEIFERMTHANAVHEKASLLELPGLNPDEDTSLFRSDLVMKISSLLRSAPGKRRIPVPDIVANYSVIRLAPSQPDRCLQMMAIIDPLSEAAQKMAPLIAVLYRTTSINVTVVLNPLEKVTELPATSFYQLVLEPELIFHDESDDSLREGPAAMFVGLPESPLFTLSMKVPHSWFVESVQSVYDLDNIHLANVEHGVSAVYELEHILIEGHCSDGETGQPTQGLQFVLGTKDQPELFDTIVMANLGYFQLKANPGAWVMRLREGKSKEIYHVVRHEGTEPESTGSDLVVALASFTGKFVIIHVAKQPGMENMDLLSSSDEPAATEDEETDDDGYWDSLTGLFGEPSHSSGKHHQISSINDTINVFSIASGHLYERFLRIMMLSVLKHTKNPVKFWFLKNFLSPDFKDFIPHMAVKYGFDYELVQYKWPHWLHQQTVKQRIIWGYKILFLDVLFPLGLKKIIFVDADQIVRADLKELVDLPLDGAPYGYTPFCDDREDMEGFRFWKRGYWSNHLGNRRYHISALYVIDLVRFRQVAAGDRLRGQYQMLSQDPNSLSNLDQDLPNNMIHQVAIKSLPQEWLWCETWCSQESKPLAKTIDLCNNPLTKEPKLTSAVRIVPEWTSYDNEIKELQDRVAAARVEATLQTGDDDDEDFSTHRKLQHTEL